eukprot:15897434-Heterocapsa_arctica.AAC.1
MDDFKEESGDPDRPCHLLLESPHLKKFIQILQAAVDDHYTGVFPGYNLGADAFMVKLIQDISASLDI